MKIRSNVANPTLAAILNGSGYRSLYRFAEAVNARGWEMYGIKTNYDHITVKRWLAGSVSQYPDVVAAVLSEAWGIDISETVIWPQLRDGQPPVAAHLPPWVAARTLEDLADFLRTDMLTRRQALSGAVTAVSGAAFLAPITRWIDVPPGRLTTRAGGGERIGTVEVEAIERSTRVFAVAEAQEGGTLSREAAVGQLKYAVDLAQHASYTDAVGNRLLAAIARLSGLVGFLCHDSGMPGPAQRYFTFGLQAARESTDPRAPMLIVSILADMAKQMRWLGRPKTAIQLYDLAISRLPADRRRFTVERAVLASKRVEDGLCYLGPSALPEVKGTLNMAFDLRAQAGVDEPADAAAGWHRALDMSEAGLQQRAAAAYLALAEGQKQLASEAERHTVQYLAEAPQGQERDLVLNQICLSRIRFMLGEPEQACVDGAVALNTCDGVRSDMVATRLRELLKDSEPYAAVPAVLEFRDRARAALANSR